MAQGSIAELVTTIRNPASLDAQIAALKQLKNEIVGHNQRKEVLVRLGLVQPLVDILSSAQKASGKRRAGESNGIPSPAPLGKWTADDESRFQATLVLGSLASGGRAFVPPLLAAETPKRLLEGLVDEVPPRLVIASLQALRSLAVSANSCGDDSDDQISLNLLDDPLATGLLRRRLSSGTRESRKQHKLAADVISAIAVDEASRAELADRGVLADLAVLLATHAIASKQFDYRRSVNNNFSAYPPSDELVPCIISAVVAIIGDSNFRAQTFIHTHQIRELLSNAVPHGLATTSTRSGSHTAAAYLLPLLHVPLTKTVTFHHGSSSFPALRSLQESRRVDPGVPSLSCLNGDTEHANAVCAWIISIARSVQGRDRLLALKLLALINNAISASSDLITHKSEMVQRSKEREKQLTMLAIPLAVKLVHTASEGPTEGTLAQEMDHREIKEEACHVLALLVKDDRELQEAAVRAGATKRICPLLKKSFDNVAVAKPMWSAKGTMTVPPEAPASCHMGKAGLPAEIVHVMRCRQSALEAISALAKQEDIHRKAIIEAGVIPCVIDSMKPLPSGASAKHSADRAQISVKDGNTKAVLLAACSAARSLSRSVSILRTSLIDAGIAKPILDLLQNHQDLDIKIAATDVLCNLVLQFSPMQDDLVANGVIKTLCEHTRQSEMGLRLSSLWALKNLVLEVPKDVKVQALEELGTGWLVGAIQGEHTHAPALPLNGGVSINGGGLRTPNAAGEQVNLLNPASMDVDDPPEDEEDDNVDEDGDEDEEDGEVMYDEGTGTHYQASQLRSTLHQPHRASSPPFSAEKYLSSVKEMEQDPILHAKRMDIAVQEQALDFVRNLLNGDDCAIMIEHLLQQIGSEKFFSLLTDKLSPLSLTSNITTSSTVQRALYNPTELIASTIHVLTHISNGAPRHKSLLIAQTPLLRAWLPHFNHSDRRVRIICVWAINALTWTDDESDREDARRRARELRNIGLDVAVKGLSGDPDLDVRERVRTAVRQLEGL